METATKNLEDDHVHILKMIDVMEKIIRDKASDIVHIETIVDIIRNFADGIHHAKEENLFFPYLEDKGFSPQQGPVAVMLHEHELGREFVKNISDNISLFKAGNKSVLTEIHYNMNGYADLLRNHIAKENNILFKMADRVLSDSDQKVLLKSFGEAEISYSDKAGSVNYVEQIQRLADFYKI